MQEAKVDTLARLIWDYHHLNHKVRKCDVILCLCSHDTSVARRAAQLFLDGYGTHLVFSGGFGRITQKSFAKPEAEIFAAIALAMGVPKGKIILENKSTNTGENIQFTHTLLQERGLLPKSILLVHKPYMERRTYATFKKQWPIPGTEMIVTSPQISYEKYMQDPKVKKLELAIMLGDLRRIKDYPTLGYQIEQTIPDEVWRAYEQLVKSGHPEK